MIEITTYEYDDEYEARINIKVNSIDCSSNLTLYVTPDVFKEFASQLVEFPFNKLKKSTFEYGEDNTRWAYYCKFDVTVHDASGIIHIAVIMDNKDEVKEHFRCTFPILTDIATINDLGEQLQKWTPFPGEVWNIENRFVQD